MNDSPLFLFVYGSLRKGFHNPVYQYISKHFTFVTDGRVKGHLYDLGDYPAAVPSTEERYIIGELYEAKSIEEFNWSISQLDDYEGIHPEEGEVQLYDRALTTVYTHDNTYTAWIYWYIGNVEGKPLIESGDVLQYARDKKIL